MQEFDRFDVAEAYWVLASLWHGGSGRNRQGRPCGIDARRRGRPPHHFDVEVQLARLGFRPRPDLALETLTDGGRRVYDGLVERFGYHEVAA